MVLVLVAPLSLFAAEDPLPKFTIDGHLGYYWIGDSLTKELYTDKTQIWGVEGGRFLTDQLEAFVSVDFYSENGKTSFGEIPLKLEIIYGDVGIRAYLSRRWIPELWASVALSVVNFKEFFPGEFEDKDVFEKTQVGFSVGAGVNIPIAYWFIIGVDGTYRFVKIPSAIDTEKINAGGIETTIFIEFRF
ncbi:MAG: hypothetical protein PHE43_00760 [Candidatus Nanoarchaeia archaeon]|nr:hypothetical protein [Candidatus Nanoarchaeia archaeon]